MKTINRVFKRENGKFVLFHKEEIGYTFFKFKMDFNFVVGIGYFTAYEDELIKVKMLMLPFVRISEIYKKEKTIIK